jgi:hypothetical protein
VTTAERHRRSLRLPEYDYTPAGAHSVTICAHEQQMIFEGDELKRIAKTSGDFGVALQPALRVRERSGISSPPAVAGLTVQVDRQF